MSNSTSVMALLTLFTLLPFLIAAGTCFIKFSIVFVMVRNALGLQQVPSNMTLNGVALLLAMFVMSPIVQQIYTSAQNEQVDLSNVSSVQHFVDNGLTGYKDYLQKYTDPDLAYFFERAQRLNGSDEDLPANNAQPSLFSLLPAYALSEIKSAFKIGFYLYLPFVVVDLVISTILLSLGMMMMSPVTISVPIKLVLFVVMDGWSLLSKGLIQQYFSVQI